MPASWLPFTTVVDATMDMMSMSILISCRPNLSVQMTPLFWKIGKCVNGEFQAWKARSTGGGTPSRGSQAATVVKKASRKIGLVHKEGLTPTGKTNIKEIRGARQNQVTCWHSNLDSAQESDSADVG